MKGEGGRRRGQRGRVGRWEGREEDRMKKGARKDGKKGSGEGEEKRGEEKRGGREGKR